MDTIYYLKRNTIDINFESTNYEKTLSKHYDEYNIGNSETFEEYFDQIDNLLTSIFVDGDNFKVNIWVDGKFLSKKSFLKRVDVFIALINHYLIIKRIKLINPITNLIDYIKITDSDDLVDLDIQACKKSLRYLNKIAHLFTEQYEGNKFLTSEIVKSGFFNNDVVSNIKDTILNIKLNDPIISKAIALGINFITNSEKDESVITFFVESFINRGKKSNDGRREILRKGDTKP